RTPNRRVGNIPVARNLIARVDDDHPLTQVVSQDPRCLAQHRGLPDPGTTEQEQALARLHQIAHDANRPVDGPPDPAGQPNDLPGATSDGGDAMQGPLDPGPVVVAEATDALRDVGNVFACDLAVREIHLAVRIARLRWPPE